MELKEKNIIGCKAEETPFQRVANKLIDGAGVLDLIAPEFKTPPEDKELSRTLKRITSTAGEKSFVVSVAIENRLTSVVIADMIEGIVVVNELDEKSAGKVRSRLWKAVTAPTTNPPTISADISTTNASTANVPVAATPVTATSADTPTTAAALAA